MDESITTATASSAEDARRARILEGATTVFLAYGFQRTTMDDIARAAEISRPALYLLFRNKSDIYRALAADFLEVMLDHARQALAGDAPLPERLEGSLFCMLDHMTEIEESPHGAEILDMKNSLAADIVTGGRAELLGLIEAAIADEAQRRRVDLSDRELTPGILADMLLDAFDGLKLRALPPDARRTVVRHYIAIVSGTIGA